MKYRAEKSCKTACKNDNLRVPRNSESCTDRRQPISDHDGYSGPQSEGPLRVRKPKFGQPDH